MMGAFCRNLGTVDTRWIPSGATTFTIPFTLC